MNTFELANTRLIQAYPKIKTYSDGTPIIEGYYNDNENMDIHVKVKNKFVTIHLDNNTFVSITGINWSTYKEISQNS